MVGVAQGSTKPKIAIGSFKQIEFLCNVYAAVVGAAHHEQRLQQHIAPYPTRLAHVDRHECRRVGGQGTTVVVLRATRQNGHQQSYIK